MKIVNISNDVEGKSAFTQWEHNIVAGYLITAGKMKNTHTQTRTVYIVFYKWIDWAFME